MKIIIQTTTIWDTVILLKCFPSIEHRKSKKSFSTTWMSRWKLGPMVSKWVISYNLLINVVYWGEKNPLILTIDPTFLSGTSKHVLTGGSLPYLSQSGAYPGRSRAQQPWTAAWQELNLFVGLKWKTFSRLAKGYPEPRIVLSKGSIFLEDMSKLLGFARWWFQIFSFLPLPGEMIQLDNIFQMG